MMRIQVAAFDVALARSLAAEPEALTAEAFETAWRGGRIPPNVGVIVTPEYVEAWERRVATLSQALERWWQRLDAPAPRPARAVIERHCRAICGRLRELYALRDAMQAHPVAS